MISYIQEEFKKILNGAEWMDEESKTKAMAKVM